MTSMKECGYSAIRSQRWRLVLCYYCFPVNGSNCFIIIKEKYFESFALKLISLRSSCSIASYSNDPDSIFFDQSAKVIQMSNACLLVQRNLTWIIQITRDWTPWPKTFRLSMLFGSLCQLDLYRHWGTMRVCSKTITHPQPELSVKKRLLHNISNQWTRLWKKILR